MASGDRAATLHPPGARRRGTYQLPPLLGDGADVHGVALHHVQEAHFGDGDGTDHMDPPGGGAGGRLGSGLTGAPHPGPWGHLVAAVPPPPPPVLPAGWGLQDLKGCSGPAAPPGPPTCLKARGHTPRRSPRHPPPVGRHLQGSSPEVAETALLREPDNHKVRGFLPWDLLRPLPAALTFQTSGHGRDWPGPGVGGGVHRAPPPCCRG